MRCVALLLLGLSASSALAQAPVTVVVVVQDEGEAGPPLSLLRALAGTTIEGGEVVTGEVASRQITQWSYVRPDESEATPARTLEAMRGAVELLQAGRSTDATNVLRWALGHYGHNAGAWGQDNEVARAHLDACMTLAEQEVRDYPAQTLDAVKYCRRLVSDLQPSPGSGSPDVHAALRELDSGGWVGTRTTVDGPEGCRVRLNGRAVGSTPYEWNALPGPYTVQLACAGRETRLHRFVTGSEPVTVSIDPAFDDRLETTAEAVVLRGSDDVMSDGPRLARLARVARVMLLHRDGHEWVMSVFTARSSSMRETRINATPTVDQIDMAMESLRTIETLQTQVTVDDVAQVETTPADVGPAPAPTARRIVGGLLVVGGVAALAVGWQRLSLLPGDYEELRAGDPFMPGYTSLHEAIDSRRIGGGVALGVGIVTLLTGLPLLMPRSRGGRIASWVMGAIGLGVSAASIPFFLADSHRITEVGGTETSPALTGAALLATGLPLVALPLIQLGLSEDVSVDVSSTTVRIRW